MINVSFENNFLHDICTDLGRAEQEFGRISAEALINLISEASAFENVKELMNFLDGDIEISVDDFISVKIGSDCCAHLVVVGTRFNRDDHGRVVWTSVTRLKLVEISGRS